MLAQISAGLVFQSRLEIFVLRALYVQKAAHNFMQYFSDIAECKLQILDKMFVQIWNRL